MKKPSRRPCSVDLCLLDPFPSILSSTSPWATSDLHVLFNLIYSNSLQSFLFFFICSSLLYTHALCLLICHHGRSSLQRRPCSSSSCQPKRLQGITLRKFNPHTICLCACRPPYILPRPIPYPKSISQARPIEYHGRSTPQLRQPPCCCGHQNTPPHYYRIPVHSHHGRPCDASYPFLQGLENHTW